MVTGICVEFCVPFDLFVSTSSSQFIAFFHVDSNDFFPHNKHFFFIFQNIYDSLFTRRLSHTAHHNTFIQKYHTHIQLYSVGTLYIRINNAAVAFGVSKCSLLSDNP